MKKSNLLIKTSVSIGLAKRVFNKRYALAEMAKQYAKTHSSPSKLIDFKTTATKAAHLVHRNKLKAEKLSGKVDGAVSHLDKRVDWAKNTEKYGKRNPSIIDKIKKAIGSSTKEPKHAGLSSVEKTPAPAYAYA